MQMVDLCQEKAEKTTLLLSFQWIVCKNIVPLLRHLKR